MPTYEYMREDGSVFEVLQKFSDPALETCPDTGMKVKRVISGGSGVIYKGDGWYITDYKNGGSKTDDKKNGTSVEKAESAPAEVKAPEKETTAKAD